MKKTTTENLSTRLTQSGTLSLASAGIANANGQIIYTDVDPDSDGTTVDSDIFLDVDNNGANDFQIRQQSSDLLIAPLLSASILGNPNGGPYDNYDYPFALSNGAIISNGVNTWIPSNGSFQTMNYYSCYLGSGGDYNNWCNVTDKYLGLRFLIVGDVHYGWARFEVISLPSNWILKDYAYNDQWNSIFAGEGRPPLGINDNIFSEIKIIALNKSIALYNLPQKTDYKIFNMSGQAVLNGNIEHNTAVLDANTLSNGNYNIELKDSKSNALIRKKIII